MRISFQTTCFLLIFIFVGWAIGVSAQKKQPSKANLQAQAKKLESQIQYNNKLLEQTSKNKNVNLNQLTILNDQINKRDKLIKNINTEISAVSSDIQVYEKQIISLEDDIHALKKEYSKLIVATQKHSNSSEILMFILASEDFNQAYRRLKYFQQYSAHRKEQVRNIQQKQAELKVVKEHLEQEKHTKTNLLSQEEQEKKKLDAEKSRKGQTISQLQKREKKLREDIRKSQAEAQKLTLQIERIIAQEIEAARKAAARKAAEEAAKKGTASETAQKQGTTAEQSVSQLTPEEKKLSNDFANNRGRLPWPTEHGTIIEHFGTHNHPLLKGIKINNDGIDIATLKDEPVRAIFNGSVTGIYADPYGERMVIVQHGNYRSIYANLKSVSVKRGQKITTKQTIGVVSTRTQDEKTVLKFQLWKDFQKLNPEQWILK